MNHVGRSGTGTKSELHVSCGVNILFPKLQREKKDNSEKFDDFKCFTIGKGLILHSCLLLLDYLFFCSPVGCVAHLLVCECSYKVNVSNCEQL